MKKVLNVFVLVAVFIFVVWVGNKAITAYSISERKKEYEQHVKDSTDLVVFDWHVQWIIDSVIIDNQRREASHWDSLFNPHGVSKSDTSFVQKADLDSIFIYKKYGKIK